MLYQDYKTKINKRVKLRKTLRKYRVPIICTICAIIMLAAAFVITKGMIFGDVLESNKIEYGNKPSFTASAVFSDVRYEFCEAKEGKWTTEVPVHMGEYKMRVVANGLFGERYSDEQSFSIVPRSIEVSVKDSSVVYGENPGVTASMAFEDKISCGQFVFGDTTLVKTDVTPVKEAVVVHDKNGKDVTNCYNVISVKTSDIEFTKRDITLTVESAEKVYDGTALRHEVWQSEEGGLVYGDQVVKVGGSFSFIIDAGSAENKGQFKVLRATEKGAADVTHHYNINQVAGALTVAQKPLSVIVPSNEFVYDGMAHCDIGFTIDPSTPLVSGHKAMADSWEYVTNAGEKKANNIVLKIVMDVVDAQGNVTEVPYTHNYSITYSEGAYISIIQRECTVETISTSITYDGQEHSFGEYDESKLNLVSGHSIKVIQQTSGKNVVQNLDNAIVIDIVDGNDVSVMSNYAVTYVNGKININKKDISISSDSLDGTYNGRAQGAEIYNYDPSELCKNHELTVTFNASVTDCLPDPIDNVFTPVIVDTGNGGEIVTENYNIIATYGTLQLKPLPIQIITDSADKIYDGTELSAKGFTYKDGSATIVGGQTVDYTFVTSIVDHETADNVLKLEILEGTETKTFNYDISYEFGTLRIDKRPITITSKGFDTIIYYDGEKHRNDGEDAIVVSSDLEFALVEGHKIRGLVFLKDSYVEFAAAHGNDKENLFNIDGIYIEGTNTPVTKNYEIKREYGILHLEKRPVRFVSGSTPEGSIIYDGVSHSYEYCQIAPLGEGNMGLVNGHTPYGTAYSSIIDAGEIDNSFYVYRIDDAQGVDVIENYEITGYDYGKLRVLPRPVTLISGDGQKMYDGTALWTNDYQIGGMGIVAGQYPVFKDYAYLIDVEVDENGNAVGIENVFDFDVKWTGGADVKRSNYIVTETDFGALLVTKRPVTITTPSSQKVYDNTPLFNTNAYVRVGTLANGQYVHYYNFASLIDVLMVNGNVAGITNSCDYEFRWIDGDAYVKSTNYEVTEDFGSLVVNKRPVIIQINSVTREYDGTPLTPNGFTVEAQSGNRGIMFNHIAYMMLSGEITRVGSVAIGHEEPRIVYMDDGTFEVNKTPNYEITVTGGTLTVTKRNILLDPREEEQEYTGKVINPTFDRNDVYHAYDSNLMGLGVGDSITVSFDSGPRTELGTSTVIITNNSWKMTNKDGEDVTDCYNIVRRKTGTLTVIPRKITIIIKDGYKEYYDGAPVQSAGFDVINFLHDIHTIQLSIVGSRTDVGTTEDGATLLSGSVDIRDKKGTDASKYYEIVAVENGDLTVEKKRPLTIESESKFFVYDGLEHKWEYYKVTDNTPKEFPMKRDETIEVKFTNDPMVAPGIYQNIFEVVVYVTANKAHITTQNYEITSSFGEITIGSIDIEITTGGGEKEYDGEALVNDYTSYWCPDAPEGLVINVIATGSQTDAGSSVNGYYIDATLNGRVFPKEGFNIVKEDLGMLTVTPVELEIHTGDASGYYNDFLVYNDVVQTNWDETNASKNPNLTLSVKTTMLRDIDQVENDFEVDILYNNLPVSRDNFVINEEKSTRGTLTMYSNGFTVKSDQDTFEYDGTPKSVPDHMATTDHKNSNHTVITMDYQSFTEVGKHENTFEVMFMDGNKDVTFLYEEFLNKQYGIVTIEPRKIEIKAPDIVEKYVNGKVLYAPNEIVIPNEYIDELNNNILGNEYGYEIGCNMAEIAWTNRLGETVYYSVPVEHFYITLNGERLSQSGFEVTSLEGSLRLSDKLIEIQVFEVSGYYDGNRLEYFADDWIIADGQLPEGYWAEIDLSGIGLSDVGAIDFGEMLDELLANDKLNIYRKNSYGDTEGVTDLFEFKFVGNPLTLKKIKLTFTADSGRKCYDGTPLEVKTYKYVGTLLEGHVIKKCEVVGSIVGIGFAENNIIDIVIVDTNQVDEYGNYVEVTDNYQIDTEYGILEIFEDTQE